MRYEAKRRDLRELGNFPETLKDLTIYRPFCMCAPTREISSGVHVHIGGGGGGGSIFGSAEQAFH